MPCMLLAVALITACQQQPQTQRNSDTRAADETTLKNLDVEWSRAATATKDLDKTVSYYAADAVVLPPNGPIATTGDAIRQIWKEYLTSPDFAGSWKAAKVEVARSGEIGYIRGTWEFTWEDANGKPASDRGKCGKSKPIIRGRAQLMLGIQTCHCLRQRRGNSRNYSEIRSAR